MRTLRAVIFDMDGTMLDTERLAFEAWQKGAFKFGLQFTHEDNSRIVGRSHVESRRIIEEHYGHKVPVDDFMAETEKHYLDALHREIPVKAGLFDLLEYLKVEKIPLGVATSTRSELADLKLTNARLKDFFQTIVTGDQVENGKPHPDIYQLAARRLGLRASDCLALEDSTIGLTAAHAAGTLALLIPDVSPVEDSVRQKAHRIFDSLTAVREWLQTAEVTLAV